MYISRIRGISRITARKNSLLAEIQEAITGTPYTVAQVIVEMKVSVETDPRWALERLKQQDTLAAVAELAEELGQ